MNVSSTASTWRDEYPFASQFLELEPSVRMHYVDEGPKDRSPHTILCVHGNPTWSFYYRSILARFRGTHRVVAGEGLHARNPIDEVANRDR